MRFLVVFATLLLALHPADVLAQDDPEYPPLGNIGQGMPTGAFGTAGTNQFTSAAGVTVIDDYDATPFQGGPGEAAAEKNDFTFITGVSFQW